MYRIRLGCAMYARMNISTDQARRMTYIDGSEEPTSLGTLRFTCMYQRRAEVGKAAVVLLLRQLQKRDAAVESIRIPCKFEQGNTAVEPLKQ